MSVTLSLDDAFLLMQLCEAAQQRGIVRIEEAGPVSRVWQTLKENINAVRNAPQAPAPQARTRPPVQQEPQSAAQAAAAGYAAGQRLLAQQRQQQQAQQARLPVVDEAPRVEVTTPFAATLPNAPQQGHPVHPVLPQGAVVYQQQPSQ